MNGPFAAFRQWLRDATPASRASAAVAAILIAALLAWLLVPGTKEEPSGQVDAGPAVTTATTGAGSAVASTPDGVNGGGASGAPTQPGSAPAPNGSPAGSPTAVRSSAGCVSPPGSAPGISDSTIKIAVGNTEVIGPAGNDVFGIPPADYLRSEYEAVIDAINRSGGIACRKVVADFYKINPADQSSMQGQCLDIADSGVFAVLDDGGWGSVSAATVSCFAQRKVLYLGAYFLSNSNIQRLYPYVFAFYNYEELYRDTAFALKDRGYFQPSNGFAKLGFLYRDCYADAINAFITALHDAGIADSQIVPFNLGCPSAFASPAALQQAVLTFQREGVTHVTTGYAFGDFPNFTKIAEQQRFRPKYGLPDETLIPISYGNTRADPNNIAGAIAITVSRNGEEHTPGSTPSAGTTRCNEIMKAHGLKSVYEEPTGAGNACSLLWILQAAMQNAPSLDRTSFAQGLNRVRSVDLSYPQGPNDFSGAKTMNGGQFWRAAQFVLDCQCWRIVDPAFRPGYR